VVFVVDSENLVGGVREHTRFACRWPRRVGDEVDAVNPGSLESAGQNRTGRVVANYTNDCGMGTKGDQVLSDIRSSTRYCVRSVLPYHHNGRFLANASGPSVDVLVEHQVSQNQYSLLTKLV
jgi:hypothetical protein